MSAWDLSPIIKTHLLYYYLNGSDFDVLAIYSINQILSITKQTSVIITHNTAVHSVCNVSVVSDRGIVPGKIHS